MQTWTLLGHDWQYLEPTTPGSSVLWGKQFKTTSHLRDIRAMEVERSLFSLQQKVHFFRYAYAQGTHACECDCYMSPSSWCIFVILGQNSALFSIVVWVLCHLHCTVNIWQHSYIYCISQMLLFQELMV